MATAKAKETPEVPGEAAALQLRQVEALEKIAGSLARLCDQFAESGAPGSAAERLHREVSQVESGWDAVKLWRRVGRLLGPSERKPGFELLAKTAAGVEQIAATRDAVRWFSEFVKTNKKPVEK